MLFNRIQHFATYSGHANPQPEKDIFASSNVFALFLIGLKD